MSADERRESILEAATRVFGERGYVGATTDAVAREAGVSQPYVVRFFGTKEQLFLAVLERALDRLRTMFREAIAAGPTESAGHRIGVAYADLLTDRGLLLSLMHGFLLGTDPVIGPAARAGYLEMYRLLRDEAGMGADAAEEFLAQGMMINVLAGLKMNLEYETDAGARELVDACFGSKTQVLLGS